jgi:hypothetical protein
MGYQNASWANLGPFMGILKEVTEVVREVFIAIDIDKWFAPSGKIGIDKPSVDLGRDSLEMSRVSA